LRASVGVQVAQLWIRKQVRGVQVKISRVHGITFLDKQLTRTINERKTGLSEKKEKARPVVSEAQT